MDLEKYATLVPDGFRLLKVVITRTTFKKKLQFSELQVSEWDTKVVSKPEKLVVAPAVANLIRNPKTKSETLLDSYCLNFSRDVYLVPDEYYDYILRKLYEYQTEMMQNLSHIIANYDALKREWADECNRNEKLPDGFGDLIYAQAHCISYIMQQVTFEIEETVNMQEEIGNNYLENLANECKKYSDALIKKASENGGKIRLVQSSIDKMVSMRKRLTALRRIDKRLNQAINAIKTWENSLPEEGLPSTDNAKDLVQLLALLSNPKLLVIEEVELDEAEEFTKAPAADPAMGEGQLKVASQAQNESTKQVPSYLV